MKTSKLLLILAVFLVILAGIYFFTRGLPNYNSVDTPYAALVENNTYFADAQVAAYAGNYQEAKSLYTKALGQAGDAFQRAQIEYKMALLEDSFGDPVITIGLYKAIVANPAYSEYPIIKAYSVQGMSELHYRQANPAITAEIFKDAPYASFVVLGNLELTYRHLEEYAVSFHPLGLPELRIAEWYAANVTAASTSDGVATSTYPELIQQAITLANADIDRTKNDPNAARLIPQILVRKASLYVRMYRNGLATAEETEQACKDAMEIYVSNGLQYQDGFARFYYAVFLARQQDASRRDDLQALLAPLYTDPGYKGSNVHSFFAGEKANLFGQKSRLVGFAKKFPEFKTLLVSLGWTTKDF